MKKLTRILNNLEADLLELVRMKRAGQFDDYALAKNFDETLDDARAQIRKLMGISD